MGVIHMHSYLRNRTSFSVLISGILEAKRKVPRGLVASRQDLRIRLLSTSAGHDIIIGYHRHLPSHPCYTYTAARTNLTNHLTVKLLLLYRRLHISKALF